MTDNVKDMTQKSKHYCMLGLHMRACHSTECSYELRVHDPTKLKYIRLIGEACVVAHAS